MNSWTTIVWFRQDLRLADNPALYHAAVRGQVIPVFVWAPDEEGRWPPGAASRWWLHHSLVRLDESLREAGSRLIIRRGPTQRALEGLIEETGARAVFWNRRYEPAAVKRDRAVKVALAARGITAESFNGSLLHEPWTVLTQQGKPYQVFTPYWKACCSREVDLTPLPAPGEIGSVRASPVGSDVDELDLLPRIAWDAGFREVWESGESAAHERLRRYVDGPLVRYDAARDRVDVEAFSRLSPHLHFGEISPRQVRSAVNAAVISNQSRHAEAAKSAETYLKELGWREFAYHLLYHFPTTPEQPLREPFRRFPWRRSQRDLRKWQRGETGFPIVDAAMRQLWATGFMPNRARMIVASFLTKDLRLPWQSGAEWFWDTLVDADLANNTLGWQWTAGCGADAAPYFRVFNPMMQAEKCDPHGDYTRRWVRELAKLPTKWLRAPWSAPGDVLDAANVCLERDYTLPMVDHFEAREAALAAFEKIRE